MSENEVKARWDRHWEMGASLEENASWIGKRLRHQRLKIMREMLSPLPKSLRAIDMGCGNGSTLRVIRESGFRDSVGIEYTELGLRAAQENGFVLNRDVFQMDAKKTTYPDRFFGLNFSEGLVEHFIDPKPFLDEQVRITDKYILLIQPDHFSIAGYALKILWDLLASEKGGVKEYSYRMQFFIDYFKGKGFRLVDKRGTQLHEQAVMLFERVG
jgi:SAM-dependent methyltransferase